MDSEDLFLQELKDQYDRQFEIKRDLETKANNVMTISGTVGTLLFGFGTFLVDKLGPRYDFITAISVVLIVGVAANIVAIAMSARAFGIRQYRFAVDPTGFFNAGGLNENEINDYRNMSKTDFYETFIWDYLKCIKHNFRINCDKASLIVPSQWFFIVSVIMIPIIIGILLMKIPGK
jgi:hypothetical protein